VKDLVFPPSSSGGGLPQASGDLKSRGTPALFLPRLSSWPNGEITEDQLPSFQMNAEAQHNGSIGGKARHPLWAEVRHSGMLLRAAFAAEYLAITWEHYLPHSSFHRRIVLFALNSASHSPRCPNSLAGFTN